MKRNEIRFLLIALALVGVGTLMAGCDKDGKGDIPTVTTSIVADIADVTAVCGGKVTKSGGLNIVALGLCYSNTSAEPTTSDSYVSTGTYTTNGIEEAEWEFNATITKMTPLTKYWVRAYAANEAGVAYGEVKEFTTKAGKTFHALTASMLDTYTQEPSEGPKESLVDDNFATYWHSAWSDGVAPLPHYIQITFPEPKAIGGFQYWFRGAGARGGDPTQFDLQTSADGVTFATVWTSAANLPADKFPPNGFDLSLDQNYTSKYFRIRIIANRSNVTHTMLSELKVYHNGLLDK